MFQYLLLLQHFLLLVYVSLFHLYLLNFVLNNHYRDTTYSRTQSEDSLTSVLILSDLLVIQISEDLRKMPILDLWRAFFVNFLFMPKFC